MGARLRCRRGTAIRGPFTNKCDLRRSKEAFPMFRAALRAFLFCLLMAAMSGMSPAQSFVLDLPLQSQRAQISQRIGITDITISYHRPLVNDRKVWDALVAYGKVWRAGANENTTIT